MITAHMAKYTNEKIIMEVIDFLNSQPVKKYSHIVIKKIFP